MERRVNQGHSARSGHVRGILLVTLAYCLLPAADAVAKLLIGDFDAVQIVWARLLFQSLSIVVWLTLSGRLRLTHPQRPWLLLATVLAIWCANFPIIVSLHYLPLAAAFALVMTAPLILTALSALLLGESVTRHQWVALAIGFAGTLIIIRPGFAVFQWAALLPALTALLFALYQIGVRRLSGVHTPSELMLYASVVPLLASSVLAPFFWVTPDTDAWLLMALMGAAAAAAHFLIVAALEQAPASMLAPFMYLQLISSTVIGLVIFADLPDTLTIVGGCIVVGAGLYGMRRL